MDAPIAPLTKSSTAPFLDHVHGVIIGGDAPTRTWALYSKKSRRIQTQGNGESDTDCSAQAKAWVASKKAELGDEFTRLWGADGFELRIWD